ncbi:MAG: hypothetical protein JNL79_15685 [Myxococcales bacterium]|nr:hypothetical protein [Myxococcales bacterium]
MRASPFAALPLLVALATPLLLPSGCSSGGAPPTTSRLCTPGNFVFCRCADLSEGTKKCADDGQSFDECACLPVEDTAIEDFGVEDTGVDPDTGTPGDTGVPKNDTCPGHVLAVDPVKDTVIDADNTGASADYTGATGACAVGTGPEHVYAIIPTGSGSLTVTVTGKGTYDPTVYMRDTDCATGPQVKCGETTGAGGTETFSLNVVTGRTYWVFVDGKAGSTGAYTLTASLKAGSFCGDGKVDTGEGCDDGNKIADDGCGNDCRPQGDPVSGGKCPGMPAHVWPGKTLSFTGSTNAYPNTYKATVCTFGTAAQDRVYAVTAHQTGTLNVKLDADFNAGLYVRATPCETGAELKCVNDVTTTGAGIETMSFPVTDGKTYYLFVDGVFSNKGNFTLTLNF